MVPTIYVPPPSRFTDRTPAAYPVILRALRAGIVLTIEWGTLHIMDRVPTWVAVALTIDALLMLGVLESRQWLIFKGRNYFRFSFAALILAYAAICAAPYFLPSSSTVAVVPSVRQEPDFRHELEAQKATLIEWLQTAQRERDRARQELDQLQKQMQDVRLRAPSAIPIPTQQQPNPQVCADLLRLLSNLSTDVKPHQWNVFPEREQDIRSVMKNLGCFAPEK